MDFTTFKLYHILNFKVCSAGAAIFYNSFTQSPKTPREPRIHPSLLGCHKSHISQKSMRCFILSLN